MRVPSLHLAVTFVVGMFPAPAFAQAVGAEFRINTLTTRSQYEPRIAADSAGNFVVVWMSNLQDGASSGLFAQRYASAGTPLGGEFRVNTFTTSAQSYPRVAAAPNGDFVVVWQSAGQEGAASYGIFAQRYASGGSPLGSEFRINSYTTSSQTVPDIATDTAGNFVVVWASLLQDGFGSGIFGQRIAANGVALGPEFRVNSFTTFPQNRPAVAADAAGNFVVAWVSAGQEYFYSQGIYAQRFDGGGNRLGGEFRVNSYTTAEQQYPVVARDASGNFLVVWQSFNQDGSNAGVFARRFDGSGASSSSEFRVNTYTTGKQFRFTATSDADGNFIVAWTNDAPQDGSGYGIFAQRYGSLLTTWGAEFRVNTYTSNYQNNSSVVAGSGGRFIVVWDSFGQDGSSNGVFGQIFCPLLTSVTIAVNGATTVCPTAIAGIVSVSDVGGGAKSHQWGYRTTSGGSITGLTGQIGPSYTIAGVDFPGLGTFFLVCTTTPDCGTMTTSNEVVITVSQDTETPAVTPPSALAVTQTLCQ